ncbi:ThuA domain-containing protein [Frigoribacterium sp. Leaf186]|uniref:ThuA domain-containing protein n=1 Tax=Frigoribacterium sp. Leaf186 TaxID=1736293 RepID=UPI0009E6FB0B|nr:ThuA domain-containing protein [Frigoribacterium sp. Leaf186]
MTRTALVVRGGWPGHDPVGATDLFVPFLERAGFDVDRRDGPDVYADAALMAGVDLVLQCVSMGSIEPEATAGLRAAVAAGTGLAGWHGGVVDSFRADADYLHLVGAQFAAHPGRPAGEQRHDGHDAFVPYAIRFTEAARDHPITRGLTDFELVTEQYWLLHDDLLDVLATTTREARVGDPWSRPVTSPAVWTRRWGRGRMAVVTPGHSVDVLEHPTVRTLVKRSLLWATRDDAAVHDDAAVRDDAVASGGDAAPDDGRRPGR